MSYNTVGSIESKTQLDERKGVDENEWNEQKKTPYSMAYEYGQEQPNAPVHIGKQAYSYDKNGNQTGWTHDVSGQRRQILWDEENRIRTIYDNGAAFHYTYDASGTRVLKGRSSGQAAYVNNEHKGGSGNMGNYTVYVNPYIVLKSGGYTKHYYIEGQRIVSKLGGGMADAGKSPKAGSDKVNYPDKQEQSREGIVRNLKFLGHDGALLTAGKSGKTPPGQIIGEGEEGGNGKGGGKDSEKFQYFYHPDHLGSSSYITDATGEVYQHLEYFAFGETFVEEHSNTHRTPYLFNGKELDEETGLYYYGARYYDAQTSIWLAVDPKMDKYPGWSAYNYTFNNPVIYTDPDGRDAILVVFPDYKVDTETRLGKLPLGHAGVLLIDNKTGMTKYYEYGRYATTDGTKGRVRSSDTDKALRLSNVVIDPETGKPTKESLNKVLGEISKKSGQGGRIQGAYVEGDFGKMNAYAQEKLKESNPQYEEYDKNREPYSLTGNNCGTFGDDVIKQDTEAKKAAPWIFNPTPDNIANEYQDNFPNVNYDPKTNTTTSGIYKGEDK